MMGEQFREQVLISFGAKLTVVQELLDYNRNVFNFSELGQFLNTPLEDEKFISSWQQYKAESEDKGLYHILQQKLVQLQFPIKAGISQTEGYRLATLKGIPTDEIPEAIGLELTCPDLLELQIYQTVAGKIPVIISRFRADFVKLIQALIGKNEPVNIPDSMGACIIAGYNNWDGIKDYRREWESAQVEKQLEVSWQEEFKNFIQKKELYQDCFILLNDGPYSAVSAQSLKMSESEWREKSLIIRREHESIHYLTRRLFSSMQNNMLDEFIADYAGIVAANGSYQADWFLRFIGLENYPEYRKGARLENYRGKKELSDAAFSILQSLLIAAAINLQNVEEKLNYEVKPEQMVMALCSLTLEELASEYAIQRIDSVIRQVQLSYHIKK